MLEQQERKIINVLKLIAPIVFRSILGCSFLVQVYEIKFV